MRIRISHILIVAALMTSLGGCIKDNNNIKPLVIQNPGIGFPYGANNKNDIIIRPSSSPQQVPGLLLVTLEAAAAAFSDIHITIADNSTAMVNAYNAANGTAIQILPRSLWNIPSELIINAGDRFAMADITINNTSGINLNQQYAIGISITGASGGNKIANNLKDLFVVFRIQNALDGRYNARGESYHSAIAPFFIRHNLNLELHTSGPNSVKVFWPETGYGVPIFGNSGTPTLNSGIELSLFLKTPENSITCVKLDSVGVFIKHLIVHNGNTYNNRWDPSTGKVYAAWGYNIDSGGVFVPIATRAWIDTLTYLGPR